MGRTSNLICRALIFNLNWDVRALTLFALFLCIFLILVQCVHVFVSAVIIWLMTNRFLVSKQMAIYLHVLMAVRFPIPLGNQPKCTPASPIITRCIGGAYTIIMQLIAFGGVQRPWKMAIIVGQILLTLFLRSRCVSHLEFNQFRKQNTENLPFFSV